MIISSCQYKSETNTTDNHEIVSNNKDTIKIKPKETINQNFEETNDNYDYSFFLKTKKELDLLNIIRYKLKDSLDIKDNQEYLDSFMVIIDEFNFKMHDLLSNFNSWSCPFTNLDKETNVYLNKSKDGKLRLYSWNTSPFYYKHPYKSVAQFLNDKGDIVLKEIPFIINDSVVIPASIVQLHEIKIDNVNHYLIVSGYQEKDFKWMMLRVYKIQNDSFVTVPCFEADRSGVKDSDVKKNYTNKLLLSTFSQYRYDIKFDAKLNTIQYNSVPTESLGFGTAYYENKIKYKLIDGKFIRIEMKK